MFFPFYLNSMYFLSRNFPTSQKSLYPKIFSNSPQLPNKKLQGGINRGGLLKKWAEMRTHSKVKICFIVRDRVGQLGIYTKLHNSSTEQQSGHLISNKDEKTHEISLSHSVLPTKLYSGQRDEEDTRN